MRTFSALLALTLAVGCSGNKGKDQNPDSGSTVTIPSIEFTDSVSATGVSGNVDADTIKAHQATNVVLGAMGLAAADEAVREKMVEHSDGARSSHCWAGPLIPQSTFTLDYTACDDAGIAGGMVFNLDPLGPIGLDFRNLVFNDDRTMNGAVGLDKTGADLVRWKTYDTIGDTPTPGMRDPINIELGGQDFEITYDGGTFLRELNTNLAVWGVFEVTPYGGEARTVLVGGTDPVALDSNMEPGEPASLPFSYLTCRCPTSGLMAMDLEFNASEISIDIDDLKTSDDGVDDPELTIEVSATASGPVEARYAGCGEYDVVFDGSAGLTFDVSGDEIQAGIQRLCDTAVISDSSRCTGLIQAASSLDTVSVTVGPNRLANAVATRAGVEFDTSYCNP